jgi:putative chitinase
MDKTQMIPLTAEYLMAATGANRENAEKFLPFIQGACKAYDITTPLRVAGFLSQIGHESGGLAMLEENLNYKAETLMRVWPKRFPTLEFAQQYARNPQKIANSVYANRMGNGDEASGEGWKYRGRGLKQLTGKDNYRAFSKAIGTDFVASPDLLLEPVNAALSAGWFWSANGLNALADKGDVPGMTKRINGGTIGLEQRQALYTKAMAVSPTATA